MAAMIFEQWLGQSLKQYQIVSLLGEGQSGPVFKARDLALQRDVALKMVRASLAERSDFRERFLQLAQAAARFDHPNLIKVLDFGWDSAMPYIVMEYLPGDTLRRMMLALRTWHKWIVLSEAVGIVRQLALALEYAHQQGVFHLSVEPSDIQLKPEPNEGLPYRPILTDLRLATLGNGPTSVHTSAASDASAYMSPEAIQGNPTDARSDVYALGVLLHELAVGQLPFPAPAVPSKLPQPPQASHSGWLDSVEQIVFKALANDPADRYVSAAALADALGQIQPALVNIPLNGSTSLVWLFQGRSPTLHLSALATESTKTEPADSFQVNNIPIEPDLIQFSPGPGWVGVYTEIFQLSVAPGNKFTTQLIVFNRGPRADHFTVSASGLPQLWLLTPPATPVMSGHQHALKLVIQPPRTPYSEAGRYPLTLQVASQNDPTQVVELRLTVTVTAYSEFSSTLNPPYLAEGERAQLTVHNQGNIPETFELAWQDLNDDLEFELPDVNLPVLKGDTSVAEFSARPRNPRLIGGLRAHPFIVQVTAPSGQTQTHTGEFMSRGLIPVGCFLVLVMLVCIVLSSAAGLIYADNTSRFIRATQTAIANQTAVAVADSDSDGLANIDEVRLGTDPLNADTDGDGLLDGDEQRWGANPLVVDTDADGLLDGEEVLVLQTSPLNVDTDGDGLHDGVDPDPGHLPTPTPIPPTPTSTPLPSLTPLPTATPLPTLTPLPATDTLPPATATPTTLPPLPSSTPGNGGGQILFESGRDGNPELYVMNADGSGQTRLTNNPANDGQAVWSPNGAHIAFVSERDGNPEIYVMNTDGTNQARLTDHAALDTNPVWSPDGLHIAFESERDGNPEIYVMKADGSSLTRLTDTAVVDCCLAWSPDGTRLAFFSERDGRMGLYLMNSDGSSQTWLTFAAHAAPAWSSDSTRLAYIWDPDGNGTAASVEIYTIHTNGAQIAQLTSNLAIDSAPRWSADNSQILFLSDRDGNPEIYLMRADGSAQSRLSPTAASECCLVWAFDGALAFASDRDGNYEVYRMNLDGSGLMRLTTHPAYDAALAWRP